MAGVYLLAGTMRGEAVKVILELGWALLEPRKVSQKLTGNLLWILNPCDRHVHLQPRCKLRASISKNLSKNHALCAVRRWLPGLFAMQCISKGMGMVTDRTNCRREVHSIGPDFQRAGNMFALG